MNPMFFAIVGAFTVTCWLFDLIDIVEGKK